MAPQKKSKTGGKAAKAKFQIDCSQPVEDKVFDTANFEAFLHEKIKVGNKAGNLGTKVVISREKAKVTVVAEEIDGKKFSKRYLKYLTKKYLKQNQLRDFLRVIATSKGAYELKFFKVTPVASDD